MSTEHTLRLIGEFLTQGGHAHGIDPDALDREAAVVAAAPDLLAALDYLLSQTVDADLAYGIELTEGEAEARQMALSAIAKATGEETNA
jgi:hypothetical protein